MVAVVGPPHTQDKFAQRHPKIQLCLLPEKLSERTDPELRWH